ncbi:type II CAAX prenyl endopeptidase Rce1 family protein [Kocuria sp. M4R2S49]|uniref:CPBP family glutamic-type intramembrane protease n=1 Tax=Kocuria rhizosphaericola TaxID=3376284 RepID=UPI0037ABC1B6
MTAFVLLALGITWAAWAPAAADSHGLLPIELGAAEGPLYLLGGIGPMVAAWIVLRNQHGSAAERRLFAPLARWRVHPGWYLLALAGPVLPAVGALATTGRLDAVLADLEVSWMWAWALVIRLLAAVPEEVAWRGFALPRWQARYGGLGASLIIGVVWALWHLPLLLDRDNVMSASPVVLYAFSVLATSVVYTWVFNSTGGSVLILTLLHGAGNAAGDVFFGDDATLWEAFHTVDAVVMTALAVVLVLVLGTRLSSRTLPRADPEEAGRP